MIKRLCTLVVLGTAMMATSSAYAQTIGSSPHECELHVWPTSNYGGVFFHAGNFRPDGLGTRFDLVSTPVERAGAKAHAAFGSAEQNQVLVESIEKSGKFSGYKVIAHDPLPPEEAKRYLNLINEPVGTGSREMALSVPCYAEIHVAYLTVFKTNLTKMLMTGFVVRYFSNTPSEASTKVIHSKPQRGEERTGLSSFDFATTTITPDESSAIKEAFKFMLDRFLRKKVPI